MGKFRGFTNTRFCVIVDGPMEKGGPAALVED
jgi:hypothetical protein